MVWTLLLSALGLALLQGWVFRHAGKRLGYRREFSREAAFQGEEIEMVETLRNPARLPLPWLRLESRMPPGLGFGASSMREINGGLYHRGLFFLSPRSQLTRRHRVRCLRRGSYHLTTVALSTGDLLGLVTETRTLDCDARLLIYPRLLSPEALPLPCLSFIGEVTVRRFLNPDPCLISGVRPYVPGDPPRSIHWNASARLGAYQVKTCDPSADPHLLILLNVARSASQWADLPLEELDPIEDALSLAVSLCAEAIDRGAAAGLGANTTLAESDLPALLLPGRSEEHKTALFDLCARMTLKMHRTFPAFLAQLSLPPEVEDVLVLSCYDDPEIQCQLEMMREGGHNVVFFPLEGGAHHG